MITLGTRALGTLNITSNASLITGTLSSRVSDARLELYFGDSAAPAGNMTVFVQDANGYAYGDPTDSFTATSESYKLIQLMLPSGSYTVRLDSDSASDTAVQCSAVLLDVSPDAVSGTGWNPLFPPREMSGDRIGFSHADSGTFYYLVNNAADATPTTFTGTAAGSTRSVLRTTVASDIADGFTVLTVYKQVGGSVVHANDTPVGAILVNKTSGTVTERLLTQTELDAIRTANLGGGGPYVDDPVAVGRLARLVRNTTGLVANGANGITIKVGDVDVLCGADFARDLPTNARVTSITSLTPSASGFTATAVGVDHTQAKFTLSASTAGTYTLAVKVAYSQSGGTVTGTVTVRVIA